MSELFHRLLVEEGTSNELVSDLQCRNINAIKRRLERHQSVPGFMLDMCLDIYPHVILDKLVDTDLCDDTLMHIEQSSSEGYEAGQTAQEVWKHVIPRITNPLSLTDSFHPNHSLLQDFDAHHRREAEDSNLDVESFWQIIKRQQIEFGILRSRLVSTDEYRGSELPYSTPDIIRTFLDNSYGTTPDYARYDDVYYYKTPETACETSPEIIIVIPVAANQERDNLAGVIEALARQKIDPKLFRVLLLHNSRIDPQKQSFTEEVLDEAIWMEDFYSGISIKYPKLQFAAGQVNVPAGTSIGFIRLLGHTLEMERYLQNDAQNNPLLLNLDADVTAMNQDFLGELLAVSEGSNKPVIASRLIWDTQEIRRQSPTAAKILRFNYFLFRCIEKIQNRVVFYDCGTAIKAREYCLAGGHSWYDMFYETGNIPKALSTFKKYGGDYAEIVTGSSSSRYKTDPRRQLDTMARGFMHERAWEKGITSFGKEDDKVRASSLNLDELEKKCIENLEPWLLEMIETNIGTIHSDEYKSKRKVIEKALKILGLPKLYDIQVTAKDKFEEKTGIKIDPTLASAIIEELPELTA